MKTQIQYINKKEKGGFIGMNQEASKSHHIKWKHKKHPAHTIEVYKKSPKGVRLYTERHEMCERYFMRVKHYNYHKAHQLALKFEEYDIPFPKTNIKKKLIEIGLINK